MKHTPMYCLWRLGYSVLCFVMIVQCQGEEGQPCSMPNGATGQCVRVRRCKHVLDLLQKPVFFENERNYLNQIKCGTLPDGSSLACCLQFTNDPECGPTFTGTRITGGNDTAIGEYPWMALLQFRTRRNVIYGICGASLISKRYVLTAAHCFNSAEKKGWEIHSVRLAEWNFMNHRGNKDCKQLKYSEICRKDYEIERYKIHYDYGVSYGIHKNDIALLELATEVEYNDFVKPICLPVNKIHRSSDDAATVYTAAGWGSLNDKETMSTRLMQIHLQEFDLEKCKKVFPGPSMGGIGVEHICAGGVRGQDTCTGDTGGPLMEDEAGVYYLAGITSFGMPKCGMPGKPGVYTNVSHYLDWIAYEMYKSVVV